MQMRSYSPTLHVLPTYRPEPGEIHAISIDFHWFSKVFQGFQGQSPPKRLESRASRPEVNCLQDSDSLTRHAAAKTLGRAGEQALPQAEAVAKLLTRGARL